MLLLFAIAVPVHRRSVQYLLTLANAQLKWDSQTLSALRSKCEVRCGLQVGSASARSCTHDPHYVRHPILAQHTMIL